MARCWPSLILLIYTFIILASAASTSLSQELTNFIPECAQECFISFLDSNFPTSICSSTPTLDCLCSHNSSSGFTVGEGALQCIVSESDIGFCEGGDSSSSVIDNAYTMCSGQDDALPNTHPTIVATLFVPSSMPSIALVPPSATTVESEAPTPTLTTPPQATTRTSSTTSTTTLVAPFSTILSLPATTQPPAQTNPPTPPPTLTKPQIVGVTVASIGGTALMLGIIAIFACTRKRKSERYRDSDEFAFQIEPKGYAKSIKSSRFSLRRPRSFGPGGTSNGIAAKMAPPVPPRLDTINPNMFSRRSLCPEYTIGLAISPESNNKVQAQNNPPSRQIPLKPSLKLQMPPQAAGISFARSAAQGPSLQGAGLSYPNPVRELPADNRQSTATQFEEDEDSTARKSYAPNTMGISFIGPVARLSALGRQSTATQFEEDEDVRYSKVAKRTTDLSRKSTATQFDEDEETANAQRNNWGRKSTAEELDTAIELWEKFSPVDRAANLPASFTTAGNRKPSQKNQRHNNNSRPAELEGSPVTPVSLGKGIGSFSQPRRPDEYPRLKQQAPGLAKAPQDPPRLQIPTSTARPVTAASSVYSTRTSSLPGTPARSNPPSGTVPPIPEFYKQVGPYDAPQTMDGRTFSENTSPRFSPNGPRTGELSPVAESTSSGRSPVSYPKIPKRGRLSAAEIKMIPPPPQPNFGVSSEKPWRQAEIVAERERKLRQNSQQQPSPYQTYRVPRLDTSFESDPQRSVVNKYYTPSLLSPILPRDLSSLPSQSQQPFQYSKQLQVPPSLAQKGGFPSPPHNRPSGTSPGLRQGSSHPQLATNPSIVFNRSSSSAISQASDLSSESKPSSISSGMSNLAQRRRGEPKAAALVLPRQIEQEEKRKWRVLKDEDVDKAKSEQWRPMLVQQQDRQAGPAELPGTPGWVPRITPTRRGDELFLNVR